jgi:hypothetical protein
MNGIMFLWLLLLAVSLFGLIGSKQGIAGVCVSAVVLITLLFQLRELPALGDSGFYLGQAKRIIETGHPEYLLANVGSSALSGLMMNIVFTTRPELSYVYSTFIVLPLLFIVGGGLKQWSQSMTIFTATASVYFLKPNYMDFYPVAIFFGSISVLVHLRYLKVPTKQRLRLAALSSSLAIASHLLLGIVVLAFVITTLLSAGMLKQRILILLEYLTISYLVFRAIMFLFRFMSWPLYPGNSTGGGDNRYFSLLLVNRLQFEHAGKILIISLLAPIVLFFISIKGKIRSRYLVFVLSLTAMYAGFLLFYGFDLGLVPDMDLQIFPAAVITFAIIAIFRIEDVKISLIHALAVVPIAAYSAFFISTLPK